MPRKFRVIFVFCLLSLLLPGLTRADYLGQQVEFFVDPGYDLFARDSLTATLKKISPKLYFYIDNKWWEALKPELQLSTLQSIKLLDEEFEERIYPTLTSLFGFEDKPGIDGDERITVLILPMREDAGGYFNNGDGYSKALYPKSNEREILYLNSQHINSSKAKGFLAHEFLHLITLNQKDKVRGVSEEIWLNEARAEYAPTLLGYDDVYEGSNLQERVNNFLDWPDDSLTEWQGKISDYGVLNLFVQYLVDHYGKEVLVDSLHFANLGISSLDYALKKNGFEESFSQVFTDWTITILLNDCSVERPDGTEGKYCYLNPNLKNVWITPSVNFLPFSKESGVSVVELTKNWAGTWYKIIGGKGTLEFKFDGADGVEFKVPIILQDFSGNFDVDYLELDESQQGVIEVKEFGQNYTSLMVIPQIQEKTSGFDGVEPSFQYFWRASATEAKKEAPAEKSMQELLDRIAELEEQIAEIRAKIYAILRQRGQCQRLENDLYYGLRNNSEVRCLQEFLRSQGRDVYPEGLVTGNFLSLTQAAVVRFQEKYASDVLHPLGLTRGTGFVGPRTRAKINEILNP